MLIDRTWGIERHPASAAFGELVAPIVYLWREPGQGEELGGALKHDTTVEVEAFDGDWVLVNATILFEGEPYRQRGWLSRSLLKEAGRIEYV